MTFATILKSNYSDLNFGYAPFQKKSKSFKISLQRFYNKSEGILVGFNVQGNDDEIAHLKSSDGVIYMTLNELKWMIHNLNDVRFSQLNIFFENITNHVKDTIAISEEFDEYYAMAPNCLQDKVFVSSSDAEIITTLFDRILTLN